MALCHNPHQPHYVYRAFDRAGQLLYIGMTNDIKRRFQDHKCGHPGGHERRADGKLVRGGKRWHPQFDHASIEFVSCRQEAEERERYLIGLLDPPFNLAGVGRGE